ncbi:hypothetical protein [Azospirillum sp. TSO22-1]|uniref:hypothetical protein n=1 Tax=Azospirillum sp. TSO22-1 TaxID=716789 RepID=UPI000D60F9A9|nr:hypothetical protein [Azospirillum sp. TSO22-1]PWC53927.1 hypothetical protein TSO221_09340 [Azospirillum sp. TSO22-1]
MPNLPPLALAQAALTQDAARLLPAARDAVNAGDTETGTWLARRAAALAPGEAWPYLSMALLGVDAPAQARRAVTAAPEVADTVLGLGRTAARDGDLAGAAGLFAALPRNGGSPGEGPRGRPDLAAALRGGASLATVMSPDPFLPSNWPEYLEGYVFDHVVVSGEHFWALPQPIAVDPAGPTATAFAYCSDERLFVRYTTAPGLRAGAMATLDWYPGDAYKDFRFTTRHDHTMAYDSARPDDTAGLEAAIRSGAPMRLVLDTGDGLVHVLPVHLAFLYKDSGRVRVLTEMRFAPELCLTPPETLWPYLEGVIGSFSRPHRYVLASRKEDGSDGIEYRIITLPDGVAPQDFPLGCLARKLDDVAGRSRLLLRKLTVHSEGHCESFGPDGAAVTHPFAGFRVYVRG